MKHIQQLIGKKKYIYIYSYIRGECSSFNYWNFESVDTSYIPLHYIDNIKN